MAPGSKGTDEGEGSLESPTSAAQPVEPGTDNSVQHTEDGEEEGNTEEDDDDEEEDSDEEEEAEEPRLKYAPLTKGQGALYRNGDAASAFLVSGDKMVLGTHNGNIHVFSLPSFQTLRVYHAHSASVTSISISPFPPPLPSTKSDVLNRVAAQTQDSSPRQQSPSGSRSEQPAIPNIPSNSIHIASSSIDGNVCVSSLVDSSDVLRRSFGRPVQSVALSPDYKNDRSYLSGGRAGSLILTVGGKTGKTSTSNTSGAAAAAGWLGSIGLGSHSGTDKELHSGEGAISTIKWSLTGKYVVWVNEEGIKIMRSNLHLDGGESEFAWKRMSHIDRPNQPGWEEMAGVWRARASWIDEDGLESTEEDVTSPPVAPKKPEDNGDAQSVLSNLSLRRSEKEKRKEKLVVGWGGTIWIIDIHPGSIGVGREAGERKIGRVEVVTKLRTDCIISGISLYTPDLLVVLAYVTPDTDHAKDTAAVDSTPRRGVSRRQNALQPEMRIIDVSTKEEVCIADTLNFSRFEGLSATDYHLDVLPVLRMQGKATGHKTALELIGGIGGSVWDASIYSTKFLANTATDATMYSAKLFTGAATGRSLGSKEKTPSKATGDAASTQGSDTSTTTFKVGQGPHPALLTRGMKIFIQSPYDCVLATKPTLSDHIGWLTEHGEYEEVWTLLDTHPEALGPPQQKTSDSTPSTPTKTQGSLADFFADDLTQSLSASKRGVNSQAEKEKRQVGEKWLQQLIKNGEWTKAGKVCGKVLQNATSWEHWVWVFAESNHFAEITPFIPIVPLRPPLSSTVYEVVLGHYISHDRPRLAELRETWSVDLFDATSIISAIESKLKIKEVREDTIEGGVKGRDWRILIESLAHYYLATARARDALRCYIQVQDADTAMALIKSQHLVDSVADDIPGLVLIRISKEQRKDSSLQDLEEASVEPIRLLVSEAHHGIVTPDKVVKQLIEAKDMEPFLYFYFRALWHGDTIEDPNIAKRTGRDASMHHLAAEGKSLVNDYADQALPLFAEYDRELFFDFLKSSQTYTLSLASAECEKRDYIPELVYILAKEGRTKQALKMIINKLGDVSHAISFAKQQDDPDLWDDLLNYSMNKPSFIRALLEEVGTSIDPITLVRKIPEGLEIVGLRDSLTRMIREYELQDSISEGVARVLRGEVAAGMERLRSGQKRGIRFEFVVEDAKSHRPRTADRRARKRAVLQVIRPGYCAACGELFVQEDSTPIPLISFSCSHIFHLTCLASYNHPTFLPTATSPVTPVAADTEPEEVDLSEILPPLPPKHEGMIDRSIGPKVRYAQALRQNILAYGGGVGWSEGCPLDVHKGEKDEDGNR